MITGTPLTFIDSCNELKPPLTVLCSHTAAKLLVLQVKLEILVECGLLPTAFDLKPIIEASPLRLFSPTMVIALFDCEIFRQV